MTDKERELIEAVLLDAIPLKGRTTVEVNASAFKDLATYMADVFGGEVFPRIGSSEQTGYDVDGNPVY